MAAQTPGAGVNGRVWPRRIPGVKIPHAYGKGSHTGACDRIRDIRDATCNEFFPTNQCTCPFMPAGKSENNKVEISSYLPAYFWPSPASPHKLSAAPSREKDEWDEF